MKATMMMTGATHRMRGDVSVSVDNGDKDGGGDVGSDCDGVDRDSNGVNGDHSGSGGDVDVDDGVENDCGDVDDAAADDSEGGHC